MKTSSVFLTLLLAATTFGQAPTIGGCAIFPADNVWNTPVDTLPVHPNSATYIQAIGPATGLKADFGSGTWNGGPIGIPFITLPGTQTKYPATFLYWDESDPGPYAIPMNAPIEGGPNSTGDRHAIAVDKDNCTLYELYRAFQQGSSWKADSGAIFDLRSHALRPAGWTSADAAGLPIFPGLVRYDEILAGEIRHAIRFTVPQTQRAYIWPARHYASSLTDGRYPPMGLRVRLKAAFDITPFPAEVQIILKALKKYGMILADNGSAWYMSGVPDSHWNNTNLATLRNVIGSNLEAVDTSSMIIDPNSGQAREADTNNPPPPPPAITVAISPTSVTLRPRRTRQFTATVGNTDNKAVTWQVNGITGGNATTGYINASGWYTAPAILTGPDTVTVRAVSVADPSKSASATVTIQRR